MQSKNSRVEEFGLLPYIAHNRFPWLHKSTSQTEYRSIQSFQHSSRSSTQNKFSSAINVSTLFFQALAFLIPGIHLDPEDISSPCPN